MDLNWSGEGAVSGVEGRPGQSPGVGGSGRLVEGAAVIACRDEGEDDRVSRLGACGLSHQQPREVHRLTGEHLERGRTCEAQPRLIFAVDLARTARCGADRHAENGDERQQSLETLAHAQTLPRT